MFRAIFLGKSGELRKLIVNLFSVMKPLKIESFNSEITNNAVITKTDMERHAY